ncbi:GrpE protein [Spatholobus suberectus]|nr:GrpE protein [Spatholobus suberectus]
MATVLRTPTFRPPPRAANSPKPSRVAVASFRPNTSCRRKPSFLSSLRFPTVPSLRFVKFVPFAFDGDAPQVQEPELQVLDPSDGAVGIKDSASDNEVSDAGESETSASPFLVLLQSYKEALANNDEVKIAELESSLKSLEDEKIELEGKIASLYEELSIEKDRILRISADFDNFRKRTERDRLSLVSNAQGEVVESLLPVLDNFERAKAQIKVETEGEEKINNSYQSIYKQFIEILTSLGVEPVETVGTPFDPLLHEAIMREDSAEFEDGIIIQEFRKGFKLGDRLLRPSMVKVSAGPGPAKPEQEAPQEEQVNTEISEDNKENEGSTETESA